MDTLLDIQTMIESQLNSYYTKNTLNVSAGFIRHKYITGSVMISFLDYTKARVIGVRNIIIRIWAVSQDINPRMIRNFVKC